MVPIKIQMYSIDLIYNMFAFVEDFFPIICYIGAALRVHQLLVRWLFSGYSGQLWVCPLPR